MLRPQPCFRTLKLERKKEPIYSLSLSFSLCYWGLNSWLLGRHSIAWATPPALFALVILETGPCFLPSLAWPTISLLYAFSCCWDDCTGPHICLFFTWDGGSQTFLPSVACDHDPPILTLVCVGMTGALSYWLRRGGGGAVLSLPPLLERAFSLAPGYYWM
jgi:hypothetical protein